MHIAVLPLGRSTFDTEFAAEKLAAMFVALEQTGHLISGPRVLMCDQADCSEALAQMQECSPDLVLVLQVTFTDAAFVVEVANATPQPLALWAVPEPRIGGRLRLNAFCGLILASHALGRNHRRFSYLYHDPADRKVGQPLLEFLDGRRRSRVVEGHAAVPAGAVLPESLRNLRIARIGQHPEGFDTCRYDRHSIQALMGVEVDEIQLDDLFQRARSLPADALAGYKERVAGDLDNLDELDAGEVDRSIRLAGALDSLRREGGYDAMAVRCWPETFTEYGGAVCGPVSMLGEARVPCACEADVYGALSQLILQHIANQPVFLVDLVDLDQQDNSGVVWHCGQAPVSMAARPAEMQATVHTNRKMALLYEFTLKAGRVTLFRLSQAYGTPKLVIATGDMLARPMAFTGTSGVIRFDQPASVVLPAVVDSGLEHHMVLAYGDYRQALCQVAAALDLPVIILGEEHG